MRRVLTTIASLLLVLFAAAPMTASPVSDFQARLAQTLWNIQSVEGMVRGHRASSRAVATPEAIGSFLELLVQNVGALTAFSSAKVTTEQERVIAEGIRSTAGQLRDLSAMISHRGFSSAASETQRLELSCRVALGEGEP